MTLARIRLGILATFIFIGLGASAHTVFSIVEISKEEFEHAERNPQRYDYDFLSDSVSEYNNKELIVSDVCAQFEQLRPMERVEYDIPLQKEEYEAVFSNSQIIDVQRLDMYWFLMPRPHDYNMYCYDAQSAQFLGEMLLPFAISPKGIMVAHRGYDCDWPLDLVFYERTGNRIYETYAFMTAGKYDGSRLDYSSSKRYNLPYKAFFVGDTLLYLSVPQKGTDSIAYLKITLSPRD